MLFPNIVIVAALSGWWLSSYWPVSKNKSIRRATYFYKTPKRQRDRFIIRQDAIRTRDLSDFKTILDFTAIVQRPERLRLLLVLTVLDIRAVGPGVWHSWERPSLADLYDVAVGGLRLWQKHKSRKKHGNTWG